MSIEQPKQSISRANAIAAGLALIIAPLVALIVKVFSFGWMMFIVLSFSPVLIAGWAMVIVIAANGFLRAGGVLRTASGGARAAIAAWATSVGVVLSAFFFVDGGDATYGSTFMYWTGQDGSDAASSLSTTLFTIAAAVWLIGWVWVLVEWIRALVQRRRAQG